MTMNATAAPFAPDRSRQFVARLTSWALALAVPIGLVAAWQTAVVSGVLPHTLVAGPLDSLEAFIRLTVDGTLLEHAWVSVRRIAIGFAIGSTVGIATGAVIGTSRLAAKIFEPTALTLVPVPAVAWIPLLVILLGIGELSKVSLVAIGSATTLILATAAGIRSASQDLVEVAQLYEKSRWTILRTVLLPSAIPSIVASARVGLALSWTLLVAAEVIASANGLGWLIWDSRNFARPAAMIAGMLAIGLLGKSTDALIARLGRYLTRWDRSYRG
ncbi:ABC transporter permease [Mycobacterium sp. 050272]|uniref:ABC transporter permease n=1 Tax=Mycobacteriaceae TaxID=1762 RepID=UPI00319B2645